jgi:hypothetical protein
MRHERVLIISLKPPTIFDRLGITFDAVGKLLVCDLTNNP